MRRATFRRGAVVAPVLVLVLALTAAGCGLRSDEKARAIPKASIPAELSERTASTTTTAVSAIGDQRVVYLVRNQGTDESLVSKPVVIRASSADEVPRAIIEQLVTNPPVDDKSDVTSAIPPGTRIRSAVSNGDVLDIDLTNLGSIESTRQRLAVAQIVFTATEIPGIRGVRFSIDGTPSAVPLDDKSSDVNAIITREDFPKLATGAVATTVPTTAVEGAQPPTTSVPTVN